MDAHGYSLHADIEKASAALLAKWSELVFEPEVKAMKLFPVIILVYAALFFVQAGTSNSSQAQPRTAAITSIKAYCQQVDDYVKRNPKWGRLFADVSSDTKNQKSKWREFKSDTEREKADTGENLNDNAIVWTKDGVVVLASFTFQSPSRDWAHFLHYYFRANGSLARISAQLNTFYGNMTVLRERFYDSSGKLLSSSEQFRDMTTQKKRNPGEDFVTEPIPLYQTIKSLPFYPMLNKQAASKGNR